MKPETRPKIHVVAAVIEDTQGRVLIAQRPSGKHMAGEWEFPGGKVERGEQPQEALVRELREELGIEIGSGPHRPIRRVKHSYPDRDVQIDVWMVREFQGVPRGLDAQALRWCLPRDLDHAGLLDADIPIVAALLLPAILDSQSTQYYSVGARESGKRFGALCDDVNAALAAEGDGADFIVMRTEMPADELVKLSSSLLIPFFAAGVSLETAWKSGASGIHKLCQQPGQG